MSIELGTRTWRRDDAMAAGVAAAGTARRIGGIPGVVEARAVIGIECPRCGRELEWLPWEHDAEEGRLRCGRCGWKCWIERTVDGAPMPQFESNHARSRRVPFTSAIPPPQVVEERKHVMQQWQDHGE
jgi:DNA-directed RNA polymerase subunit RPC12/RpoP